jgi:hypothetical protein
MRLFLSVTGNVLVGLLAALAYAGYALATGTQATPALLGGLVLGALTFVVLFIVTRAMVDRPDL